MSPDAAVISGASLHGLEERLALLPGPVGEQQTKLGTVEPPLRRGHRDRTPIVGQPRRVLQEWRTGDVAEAEADLDRAHAARPAVKPAGGVGWSGRKQQKQWQSEDRFCHDGIVRSTC